MRNRKQFKDAVCRARMYSKDLSNKWGDKYEIQIDLGKECSMTCRVHMRCNGKEIISTIIDKYSYVCDLYDMYNREEMHRWRLRTKDCLLD